MSQQPRLNYYEAAPKQVRAPNAGRGVRRRGRAPASFYDSVGGAEKFRRGVCAALLFVRAVGAGRGLREECEQPVWEVEEGDERVGRLPAER